MNQIEHYIQRGIRNGNSYNYEIGDEPTTEAPTEPPTQQVTEAPTEQATESPTQPALPQYEFIIGNTAYIYNVDSCVLVLQYAVEEEIVNYEEYPGWNIQKEDQITDLSRLCK